MERALKLAVDDFGVAHRRLSRAQAETLRFIEFHDGRCAVCGISGEDLVVDHDHWSGLVRGFLCYGCNGLEGAERADGIPLFARYRRRHPAAILDYYEAYTATGVAQIVLSLDRRETARMRNLNRTAAVLVDRIEQLAGQPVEMPPNRPRELWDDDYLRTRRLAKALVKLRDMWTSFAASRPAAEVVEDPRLADTISLLRDFMSIVEDVADRCGPSAGLLHLADLARGVSGSCSAVLRYVR